MVFGRDHGSSHVTDPALTEPEIDGAEITIAKSLVPCTLPPLCP